MRKIFTFLVLLCCATTLAFSAPVGRQQARQAALAFIKSHVSTNSQVATRASQATPSLNEVASTNAYYIFNVGKGQGFVIASADDRTADVLGYAEEGTYDEQQCPASLKMLLAQYRQEVSMLNNIPHQLSHSVLLLLGGGNAVRRQYVVPLEGTLYKLGYL